MIEQGRMAPRGLAEVERARADGRWDRAYGAQLSDKCSVNSMTFYDM